MSPPPDPSPAVSVYKLYTGHDGRLQNEVLVEFCVNIFFGEGNYTEGQKQLQDNLSFPYMNIVIIL